MDGDVYIVTSHEHHTPGKGRAVVCLKIRHVRSGRVLERTFSSVEKIELADMEYRKLQFLYREAEDFVFMDTQDYDQIHVPAATVGDAENFLLENINVNIAMHEGTPLYLEMPASVVMEITYTEPGLQGDRSTGGTKPATVETGYQIQVPLFLETGTKVKVDTRTGEYLGRVND